MQSTNKYNCKVLLTWAAINPLSVLYFLIFTFTVEMQTGARFLFPGYLMEKGQKLLSRWRRTGPTTALVTLHLLHLLAFGGEYDLVWQKKGWGKDKTNSTHRNRMVHIVNFKKTKKKQLNMLSVSVTAVIIYRKKSIGPEVRQTILWLFVKEKGGWRKRGRWREGWEDKIRVKGESPLVSIYWECLCINVICDHHCLFIFFVQGESMLIFYIHVLYAIISCVCFSGGAVWRQIWTIEWKPSKNNSWRRY